MCPVLWVLTSQDGLSRPVVGAGPPRSAAGIPKPMGLGRGWTEVTGSGQDRTQGIWAQDCGSRLLLLPHSSAFSVALNLEHGGKRGSKTGLHDWDPSYDDPSSDAKIPRGLRFVIATNNKVCPPDYSLTFFWFG